MLKTKGFLLIGIAVVLLVIAGGLSFNLSTTGDVIDTPRSPPPSSPPTQEPPSTPPPTAPPQEPPSTPPQIVMEFTVQADDSSFSPNRITLERGDVARITFQVSTTNVAFDGLDFRSTEFNTGAVPPGGSSTVEFTAEESFTVTSYWPDSNRRKTDMQIMVT